MNLKTTLTWDSTGFSFSQHKSVLRTSFWGRYTRAPRWNKLASEYISKAKVCTLNSRRDWCGDNGKIADRVGDHTENRVLEMFRGSDQVHRCIAVVGGYFQGDNVVGMNKIVVKSPKIKFLFLSNWYRYILETKLSVSEPHSLTYSLLENRKLNFNKINVQVKVKNWRK